MSDWPPSQGKYGFLWCPVPRMGKDSCVTSYHILNMQESIFLCLVHQNAYPFNCSNPKEHYSK